MKYFFTLTVSLILSLNLFGQTEKINELISQGTTLHDEGKYDEAIAKYKAALAIDSTSTAANYEISYSYMVSGKYAEAISYSLKVLRQNTDNQYAAYIVLGSSYDLIGEPQKAIAVYEEGLVKFPKASLLNYNLALTLFNQNDLDQAELVVENAIMAKPVHASSHMLLSQIMMKKGERVKAMLPLYYFLMLEPNSNRSKDNLTKLMGCFNSGIEKKDDKHINISIGKQKDSDFTAAEMMVSLLGAKRFGDEKNKKSGCVQFVEENKGILSVLGEFKKEHKGFWWDVYVTKFSDLVQSGNIEAFSYYISQSLNSDEVNIWISMNPLKMQSFKEWFQK